MQHSAAPQEVADSGAGLTNMTTGSTGGPMMAMPQAPLNGNPVMGSVQQQQPSPSGGGVNGDGNQIINNPTEGAQQFCLRWNSYPATVATQLAALRAAEDFVDVTLACDGRQLRAHKLVLSACSPYFMQLFKSTPCKHPVIFLKDVGFRQLVALLEFMYAGEVNVSQAELPALLRTAEALQVRGLADTNPNNNNFPSPSKPSFPQTFEPGQTTIPAQNPQQSDSIDPSIGGGVCSSQNAGNTPCDSSSNVMNPCSNVSSGKRSGKTEEEESDSNDSQDFEMGGLVKPEGYMNDDSSISQQYEDTGEVFPQNIGDENSFDLSQDGDLGGELLPGDNNTDEEGTDVEEDENSLDCSKDFPGFPNDGSYGNLGDLGAQNGGPGSINAAGPSGNNNMAAVHGNEVALVNGGPDRLLPPPPPGEGGRGRNRLARSLWPPGIPYHGPQQCPYCPRVLSNVGNWRKHVLTMHFAREKVYKCHLCSSAFRTSEYLQKHYVRVHNYPQKMTRKKFAEQS